MPVGICDGEETGAAQNGQNLWDGDSSPAQDEHCSVIPPTRTPQSRRPARRVRRTSDAALARAHRLCAAGRVRSALLCADQGGLIHVTRSPRFPVRFMVILCVTRAARGAVPAISIAMAGGFRAHRVAVVWGWRLRHTLVLCLAARRQRSFEARQVTRSRWLAGAVTARACRCLGALRVFATGPVVPVPTRLVASGLFAGDFVTVRRNLAGSHRTGRPVIVAAGQGLRAAGICGDAGQKEDDSNTENHAYPE
jgi:hypothetical protein